MTKEIFTEYYLGNSPWNNPYSKSGIGSAIQNTNKIRAAIPKIIKDFNIKTFLDLPCGDFNWMKSVDLSYIEYTGADIVDQIIIDNNIKYSSKNIKFIQLDLVNDNIPTFDLIMVRDCLVHLPINDVKKAIKNIKKSNSKYIFTTTFNSENSARPCNADTEVGSWGWVDLQVEPYNFIKPILLLSEEEDSKHMGLWKISELPDF
jgi:SAM-dependent methyltransferase